MEVRIEEFLISSDKSLLKFETIYKLLSDTYWANKRPVEKINISIENSLCFGVYHGERQVGFARVVTDWATNYWLCDVVIDNEYRGRGLGKQLIETITQYEKLKDINGILRTANAHGLYEKYGFKVDTERCMVRRP